MNTSKIAKIEEANLRSDVPSFRVGDTVAVHYKIVEGDKLRVQVFKGIVLKQHRAGARSTVTVRKTSFGVGVERTFMIHTPRLDKIEIISQDYTTVKVPAGEFKVLQASGLPTCEVDITFTSITMCCHRGMMATPVTTVRPSRV